MEVESVLDLVNSRNEALRQRDKFKAALEEVAASHGGVRPGKPLESIAKMAREVLDSDETKQ